MKQGRKTYLSINDTRFRKPARSIVIIFKKGNIRTLLKASKVRLDKINIKKATRPSDISVIQVYFKDSVRSVGISFRQGRCK